MSGFLDTLPDALPIGIIDISGLREDAGVPDDLLNAPPDTAPKKDGLESVLF
jgi:hypothetical protein